LLPQDHQKGARADQDYPGKKLLTIDFAGKFSHFFALLHLGYSMPASEKGRGMDVSSDFGGKPASCQIFSPFLPFLFSPPKKE
jgi:hypothetical protein